MLTFVGVATQAFVMSTMFKVRGQELSEATTWIQQDLENVRFEAGRLNMTPRDATEHASRCSASDEETGYADLLRDEVFSSENGSSVNETGANSPRDRDRTSAVGDRPYVLRRVMTPSTSAPYHVLEVRYAVYALNDRPANVTDTTNSDAIATSYSEIIPNASFACQ